MFKNSYRVAAFLMAAVPLFSMELQEIELDTIKHGNKIGDIIVQDPVEVKQLTMSNPSVPRWKYEGCSDAYNDAQCTEWRKETSLWGVSSAAAGGGGKFLTWAILSCCLGGSTTCSPDFCNALWGTADCSSCDAGVLTCAVWDLNAFLIIGTATAACAWAPWWKKREDEKCPWIGCNFIRKKSVQPPVLQQRKIVATENNEE